MQGAAPLQVLGQEVGPALLKQGNIVLRLMRSYHASHPHMVMFLTGIKTLAAEFPIDKLLIVNSTNQYVATFLDC